MKQVLTVSDGSERVLIAVLDTRFARLDAQRRVLIASTSPELLYMKAQPGGHAAGYSVAEYVVRGAAAIEQTCGGTTTNLWDDPFEWTLPENLVTAERILEYLDETEATRTRAFTSLSGDGDLHKQVRLPSGAQQSLMAVLVDTLVRAADYNGRAIATLRVLRDAT
jgi:hypothetical protein